MWTQELSIEFDHISSIIDIFKVPKKEREGSLTLTILIICLKFICFPNLVFNYTFRWLCSVSVECTTPPSNWCLSLLLSHDCVISLILNSNRPCVPELHALWEKEFGLKPSMILLFLFLEGAVPLLWCKRKKEKSLCHLFHACSLLKASAEICLIIPSIL